MAQSIWFLSLVVFAKARNKPFKRPLMHGNLDSYMRETSHLVVRTISHSHITLRLDLRQGHTKSLKRLSFDLF